MTVARVLPVGMGGVHAEGGDWSGRKVGYNATAWSCSDDFHHACRSVSVACREQQGDIRMAEEDVQVQQSKRQRTSDMGTASTRGRQQQMFPGKQLILQSMLEADAQRSPLQLVADSCTSSGVYRGNGAESCHHLFQSQSHLGMADAVVQQQSSGTRSWPNTPDSAVSDYSYHNGGSNWSGGWQQQQPQQPYSIPEGAHQDVCDTTAWRQQQYLLPDAGFHPQQQQGYSTDAAFGNGGVEQQQGAGVVEGGLMVNQQPAVGSKRRRCEREQWEQCKQQQQVVYSDMQVRTPPGMSGGLAYAYQQAEALAFNSTPFDEASYQQRSGEFLPCQQQQFQQLAVAPAPVPPPAPVCHHHLSYHQQQSEPQAAAVAEGDAVWWRQQEDAQAHTPSLESLNFEELLYSWAYSLRIQSSSTVDLALHLWSRVQPRVPVWSLAFCSPWSTVLAACLWSAAKLEEKQAMVPNRMDVVGAVNSATVRAGGIAWLQPAALRDAELIVCESLGWRLLEGWLCKVQRQQTPRTPSPVAGGRCEPYEVWPEDEGVVCGGGFSPY